MTDLAKFFDKKSAPVHPKVRFWENETAKGTRLRVELWHRETGPLATVPPTLNVLFLDEAQEQLRPPDEVEWDPRINEELIRLGAAAMSMEHEAERFAWVLKDRLAVAQNRFGDGFFSAVLVEYLRNSAFAQVVSVAEMLRRVNAYAPSAGPQRDACIEVIEQAIGYCIDSLHQTFKYSKPQTIEIVSSAIAQYLDDRFSVSARVVLGWE